MKKLYRGTAVVTVYFTSDETEDGQLTEVAREHMQDEIECYGMNDGVTSVTTFSPVESIDSIPEVQRQRLVWGSGEEEVEDVSVNAFFGVDETNSLESTVAGLSTP